MKNIMHSDEVISMSNCTKNWLDIFKNEEEIRIWIFVKIFEIVNIYQRSTCNIKYMNTKFERENILRIALSQIFPFPILFNDCPIE